MTKDADVDENPPTCPHGCGQLRWAEDAWICDGRGGCGDEWPPEVFAQEQTHAGT